MTTLREIYHLLRDEYAPSRHIVWRDEQDHIVNDVTHTLRLLVAAAKGLRTGDETGWRKLVRYCILRSTSACVLLAMDVYLKTCGEYPPLPLICIVEERSTNWRGGKVPLLDETDSAELHAPTPKPEPDRQLILKKQTQWSHEPPLSTRAHHPKPTRAVASNHWLFAS